MREALAVHWHGIELESYYDGVAGVARRRAARAASAAARPELARGRQGGVHERLGIIGRARPSTSSAVPTSPRTRAALHSRPRGFARFTGELLYAAPNSTGVVPRISRAS